MRPRIYGRVTFDKVGIADRAQFHARDCSECRQRFHFLTPPRRRVFSLIRLRLAVALLLYTQSIAGAREFVKGYFSLPITEIIFKSNNTVRPFYRRDSTYYYSITDILRYLGI